MYRSLGGVSPGIPHPSHLPVQILITVVDLFETTTYPPEGSDFALTSGAFLVLCGGGT